MSDNIEKVNDKKDVRKEDNEFATMQLLGIFKEQNKRQSIIIGLLMVLLFLISAGSYIHNYMVVDKFINYLNEFEIEASIDQTGVYTFIDSEGNLISSEISPEEMRAILEVIDGKDKDND